MADAAPTAASGTRQPRPRFYSLKDHVPENHGNHPDNHTFFRDLRAVGDELNNTKRFHFEELESCVDPPKHPGPTKSRSAPMVLQYGRPQDSP